MSSTSQMIIDLETRMHELERENATLLARLQALDSELEREHQANQRLSLERDHFKSFGIELATRVTTIAESCTQALKAAELAPFKPNVVKPVAGQYNEVDEALNKLAKNLAPVTPEIDDVEEPA